MGHGAHFLADLVIVLGAAAVATVLFHALRLPLVLGYILAGLIIGPHVPVPLVADPALVGALSELGVILLMFSIGTELDLGKLARVGPQAGVTAAIEVGLMVTLGYLLGQTLVALDGDRASTETYVCARHLLLGAEQELAFAGRYLDQLECRDGQWKISHRRVVMDWCHRVAVDVERSGDAFGALSKGAQGEPDPSYELFGNL